MYSVKYFPTVVPTKKITLILLLRFPGNALQLDYITYNILSFGFHSQARKQTDLLLDVPVHTLLFLSETNSIPENKQSKTWKVCDTLHILYKICTEQRMGCKLGHSACRPASQHQTYFYHSLSWMRLWQPVKWDQFPLLTMLTAVRTAPYYLCLRSPDLLLQLLLFLC